HLRAARHRPRDRRRGSAPSRFRPVFRRRPERAAVHHTSSRRRFPSPRGDRPSLDDPGARRRRPPRARGLVACLRARALPSAGGAAFRPPVSAARAGSSRGLGSPSQRARAFVARALAERRADPLGWARLLARKAWEWLRPYPTPWYWPAIVVWASALAYLALYALAAVGFVAAPRPGVRAFALAVLAISAAMHVAILVV